MHEPDALTDARTHLSAAEDSFLGDQCEYHIDEGFALLEELISDAGEHEKVANNLGTAYFARMREMFVSALSDGSNATTPTLKRLLGIAHALERTAFSRGTDIGELRRRTASSLLTKHFDGYSDEEKQRMTEKLLRKLNS